MVTIDLKKVQDFEGKVENLLTLTDFNGEQYNGIGLLFGTKLVYYDKCKIKNLRSGHVYGVFDLSKIDLTYSLCWYLLHKEAINKSVDDALDNLPNNLLLKEEEVIGYFSCFKKE